MTTMTAASAHASPSDLLEPAQLVEMLAKMLLIRRFEERTAQSYQQAKIGGFCHLYIGQEACAVGSIAALGSDDPIITAYRDHGHALARGTEPKYLMAEMFGKVTGCAKGKGGSMHFFDKSRHMYGGHAIVGGQCPLGIGLAFAAQYEKRNTVTVCYMGDGALNQGAVHEAMNLAAIWRLPIIFVVENNMYSMGTHIARGTSMAHDLSAKAQAYGMAHAVADGMNVLDVYDTFKRMADQVRASTSQALGAAQEQGIGPAFIDVQTYRFKGHSMSDPQKYRSKDEVGQYEEQDPIMQLRHRLMDRQVLTESQFDELDAHAKQVALQAVEYANTSADLGPDELYTDVYSQPYPPYLPTTLPTMLRGDSPRA